MTECDVSGTFACAECGGDDWHLAVTHDVDVFTIDTSEMTSDSGGLRYD